MGDGMKILVFTHKLEVGGVQVNTIDLSAALRDTYGHDVVLFGTPGPMVEVAEKRGLRFLPAPASGPTGVASLSVMRALREVVRRESPDILHVWYWNQAVNAFYATHLLQGVPMLVSDMVSGGSIYRFLPRTVLTTFGTPEFVDQARAAGRKRVGLLVPPVDTHMNSPSIVDPLPFRTRYRIDTGSVTLVTVSRLSEHLKLESLCRTIDAVRELGRKLPLQFIVVGDGAARAQVERVADEANSALGRRAVTLTGELLDPRPAYAAADIVVGMGGSALRGAAFGKPVIVVGEKGFSAPLTPQTAGSFYYYGIYGIGDGNPSNASLIDQICALAEDREKQGALGAFSRQFVLEHFALEKMAAQLEAFCRLAVDQQQHFMVRAADGLRTAVIFKLGGLTPQIVRRLVKKAESSRASRLIDDWQKQRCYPALQQGALQEGPGRAARR
jgi:glycosyltransferase involved in cell wall biosynthesis